MDALDIQRRNLYKASGQGPTYKGNSMPASKATAIKAASTTTPNGMPTCKPHGMNCRTSERKPLTARKPVQLKPENRYLVVSQSGDPLVKSSFDSAWQRMIKMAIAENIITPEDRFSLHGLKHRGVTDTEGTRADKKDASGHKSDAAFNVYDHEMQTVKPPKMS